ncbi:tetratricopeptide repeat protein [Streptomyces sp. NPDC055210]
MARHRPNDRLGALIQEAGWSAAQLARAVNTLGRAQSVALRYDRTSVAHWLTGSRPRPPVPHLVSQALTQRIGRLVTVEDTGLSSAPAEGTDRTGTGAATPVERLAALTRMESDTSRRGLVLAAPYDLASPLPEARSGRAAAGADLPTHRAARVTPFSLQALDNSTEAFSTLFNTHGGAHARTALAAYLADDATTLLTATTTAPLHRSLLTATARLTHLLALMTADAGHQGLAQNYFRASLTLSREGGHATTQAITLRAMSTQAWRLGHIAYAHQLAEAATSTAKAAPPAARTFLHAQHALTLALTDQPRAARASLASAETFHTQASTSSGLFTSYSRAALDYQRAQTLLALGEPLPAITALRDSLRHRHPSHHRQYALTQARLAETLLKTGDLEAACVHWNLFLDHYPHLNSAQARTALQRTLLLLPRHRAHPRAAAVWRHAASQERRNPAL